MKKDKTNLIFIVSVLISLMLLSFLISFFKVIQNKNRYTSNVLATLSNKIVSRDNDEILTEKFSELKSINNKISNYFIEPEKINLFINYLEELGTNNNTKLVVKNAEIPSNKKDTILVKVSISGTFNNVIKVIYLLENSPFYINLTQAFVNEDIQPTTPDNSKTNIKKSIPTWQADVSFSVLSLSKE